MEDRKTEKRLAAGMGYGIHKSHKRCWRNAAEGWRTGDLDTFHLPRGRKGQIYSDP